MVDEVDPAPWSSTPNCDRIFTTGLSAVSWRVRSIRRHSNFDRLIIYRTRQTSRVDQSSFATVACPLSTNRTNLKMPKVARTAKFRIAKSATDKLTTLSSSNGASHTNKASKNTDGSADVKQQQKTKDLSNGSTLSRGQRKRLAKREQYLRREQMILSSLVLKRREEQKTRIDGLDAIKEALLETAKGQKMERTDKQVQKADMLKSNKSRQRLVAKEVTQMNLVMQHPSFQADPFATIREHLKNTLAKDAENNKKQAVAHVKARKEKEERRKAIKKEQGIKKKRHKFKATRSKAR